MAAHNTDIVKLNHLINELNTSIKDCQATVDTFLGGNFGPEANGNSLLDVKSQLLTEYITLLSVICLRRVSPPDYSFSNRRSLILQTTKVRTMLEKAMSIEHGMSYQLEKLVQTAVASQTPGVSGPTNSGDDPLSFRPRPANLSGGAAITEESDSAEGESGSEDEDSEGEEGAGDVGKSGKGGVGKSTAGKYYVPPKLISMAGVEDDKLQAHQERDRKRVAKLRSSVLMSELRAELNTDEPVEIRESGVTDVQRKLDKLEQDRTRYEEDNFVRLPTSSKKEKSKNRLMSGLGGLTDFRDLQRLMGDGGSGKKGKSKGKIGRGKKKGKGRKSR